MANPVKIAKKQVKAGNKIAQAQAVKARAEATRTGRPVSYGQQAVADWRHSTEDQPVSIKTTTPEQENVLNSLYQGLPQGIQNLNMPGGQSNFAPIAHEARRNFSENTIPTLAERFAGLGRNSSGLQQTLGGAGAQFESQLAAAQAQHGLQEQSLQSHNLFNSLGAFLHPQFDYQNVQGQNSGLRNAWNGAKGLAYNAALGYLNPAGAAGGLANSLLNRGGQQQQQQANGTGAGSNSIGFSGVKQPAWQPQQNQLSTQQLAGAGYNNLGGGQGLGTNDILGSIRPY